MTVGEKEQLKLELLGARRALDVLRGEAELGDVDSDGDTNEGEGSAGVDAESPENELNRWEDRGIERVLNAAPIAR
jgi:hypothetical protein